MADYIEMVMERMLPELKDFEEKGMFTAEEISSIVAQRRSHEYILRRKKTISVSDDYLHAIQYELDLDSLRKKRKNDRGIKKVSISDYGCMKRIQFLFDRALKSMSGDIKWWFLWFSCRFLLINGFYDGF